MIGHKQGSFQTILSGIHPSECFKLSMFLQSFKIVDVIWNNRIDIPKSCCTSSVNILAALQNTVNFSPKCRHVFAQSRYGVRYWVCFHSLTFQILIIIHQILLKAISYHAGPHPRAHWNTRMSRMAESIHCDDNHFSAQMITTCGSCKRVIFTTHCPKWGSFYQHGFTLMIITCAVKYAIK